MSHLFTPLQLRGLTLKNRVMVSPMCMYSATREGAMTDWHLVHLGSRAVGGAALVMTEATAVESRGRLSLGDTGLYDDLQIEPMARVLAFCKAHGAATAVQLAHGGRKAWSDVKGHSTEPDREPVVGPSPLPFDDDWAVPHELTRMEIRAIHDAFLAAAKRALQAGADMVEIHSAHGYLLHSFLSPLCNKRTDDYGGPLGNRARFLYEVAGSLREFWPKEMPLLVRISADDWADGGFRLHEAVEVARNLKSLGVDLIDCSSGGAVPFQKIALGPGYQVPFSAAIRRDGNIPTAAVGLITEAQQAEDILLKGEADLIALARAELVDPYWPLHAAHTLGAELGPAISWSRQYGRAVTILKKD
jgi:2,4-dienoyl-CoA reductase-like NADH-dependent reductase (Old Yellow Enzyme family)